MKKILIALILSASCFVAKAQLTPSKWTGVLTVPDPTNIILDFKKDNLVVYLAENGQVLETMSYTTKNDTIYLKKINGGSPCETGSAFTVKYSIKDDKLTIQSLVDDCVHRSSVWPKEPFTRLKE